ncbi:unnamed protein product [Linum tenue]|uniref:Uncharacterized protein n=1 Tax=Linum tenue TaxID=586396 RepID=A0AAV0J1Z1_9ROSI|nr:unnamed protein product [Linum tenue]
MRRKIMTAAKKTRRKIKLYRCPKISIAQLNDFETMEAHTVEEDPEEYFCGHYKTTSSIAKAKIRVKLQVQDDTREADFATLDHEATTKILEHGSLGESTSCGLKRKHADAADPVEEYYCCRFCDLKSHNLQLLLSILFSFSLSLRLCF